MGGEIQDCNRIIAARARGTQSRSLTISGRLSYTTPSTASESKFRSHPCTSLIYSFTYCQSHQFPGIRNRYRRKSYTAIIHSNSPFRNYLHLSERDTPSTACLYTSYKLKLVLIACPVPDSRFRRKREEGGPLIVLGRVRSMSGHQRCSEDRRLDYFRQTPSALHREC